MAMVRKKQDDKYLEALRELITTGGGNRQCFDCGQKGPTYVNMTIGSFVCTRCSGVLRGITPPHRVKSISMATFTQDEIDFLKAHGNDVCAKTWLGLWDPKRAVHQDQRELMIDKYERKRYFLEPASPLKSLTNATTLNKTTAAATSSTSSVTATAASSSANNSQNNNNSKTQIQLTPPTSQRTTANGLHKTSSTAISRPHHSTPQVQNGFSSSLSSHATDAFGLHNGLNSSVGSMSTGALSDTSSCASANGFGAEADFVADFGSADIFNATVASSPASSIGSSTTNNGYAKIQQMKMSTAAQQQFMNGHGGGGGVNNSTNLQNGNLVSNSNGNTENFADFDHAPIYNAAVEETANYQFVRKNAIRKKSTSSISGSIIRRNERQLKDILEMDNNENSVDYINFNEDDVFGEKKSYTTNPSHAEGYRNLFDDFDAFLTLDNNRQQTKCKSFESDYANVSGGVEHKTNGSKFTPLALAAHATAMAVLGNQSHFNNQTQATEIAPTKSFENQWDAWSSANNMTTNDTALSTSRFPSSYLNQYPYEMTQQQQQQQQQQQHLYASIANFNTPLQNHSHQYLPSSTLATQSSLAPSPSAARTIFDTAKTTTIPSVAATTMPTTKIQTTSMLNKNTINTTNPFRMHLDVNDNYNTITNYDNDYNFNNLYNTTSNTTTATSTLLTTDTDFNIQNSNDFNFVSNSILSYNFDLFSTATQATSSYTYAITTTTPTLPTTNSKPIENNHTPFTNDNNNNSQLNYKNHYQQNDDNDNDDDDAVEKEIANNSFLNSSNNLNAHKFSIYQMPCSAPISSSTLSSSTTSSFASYSNTSSYSYSTSQKNPFIPVPSDLATAFTFRNSVAVDDNANNENSSNCYERNNNYNYSSLKSNNNNENFIDARKDVANSLYCSTNNSSNNNDYFNSNCNFNSFSNTSTNANQNQIQNPNNYYNDNFNNNNNSWRLPINNNKNSTTNGFNNNINKINNNNNSSAPAEDRYAALKDLDEQLRESKAVAAQAASIVTANVVDSGFGNPNANGTVNPFATHQQTNVVNPFQNASNNPTQNTTQQLFGQMTLIPNGIAAANGFLNAQKTHTANTGFFNYTASGFTNTANTPQLQQQQHQHQQNQASILYPTSMQTGPNGCGFGFGTLQQQIVSNGTGLTTNTFNNPFAATGALNSNNPFL